MKNIHSKKYSKIKKLLQSPHREDVIIGLSLVTKEFSRKELLYNFPNEISNRSFSSACYETMWMETNGICIGTGDNIYAFPLEGNEGFVEVFKDSEIKI